MNNIKNNTAVLLLAFGGPENITEVGPFLKSVLAPRDVSIEQIKNAEKKYEAIGGRSPILDITKRQASDLEKVLNGKTTPQLTSPLTREERRVKAYVGMRFWHPFISDTLNQMKKDGIQKAIAVIMAPNNSAASTGGYIAAVEDALENKQIGINFVPGWHTNEKFLNLLAERINKELAGFEDSKKVHVVFSAHSLPLKTVENDPYVEQLNEMINGVQKITGGLNYTLAYQSKGGGSTDWLGPEVGQVLEELAQNGQKDILLVPLSFVTDNIETLYDVDIVFKQKAESLGLNFKRTPCFNDSPDFIDMLACILGKELSDKIPRNSLPLDGGGLGWG